MFENSLKNRTEYCKMISRNFGYLFAAERRVVHMDNEKYKKYIIEMLLKINDNKHLERIYNYVHKYFIRRTGE